MKPFVKWVGGKTQILKDLENNIPKYNKLWEPFVGGGAFFISQGNKKVAINDINKELITTYLVIKTKQKKLKKILKEYEEKHSKDFFDKIKKEDPEKIDDEIKIAARFIYLNKTCFNGMYRVNSNNEFNVPWGKKENPNLFDEKNLDDLHIFFKKIDKRNFKVEDFKKNISRSKRGDLIFADPPYDYENKNGFNSYSKNGFDWEQQKILFKELKKASKRGVFIITTNHMTKRILDLYNIPEFNITKIKTNRFINSNAKKRVKSADEVIIRNF